VKAAIPKLTVFKGGMLLLRDDPDESTRGKSQRPAPKGSTLCKKAEKEKKGTNAFRTNGEGLIRDQICDGRTMQQGSIIDSLHHST